jgi:hypothetical protein
MFNTENWKVRRKKDKRDQNGLFERRVMSEKSLCALGSQIYMPRPCSSPFLFTHLSERTAPSEWVGDSISSQHDGAVQQATTGRTEQVRDWQALALS